MATQLKRGRKAGSVSFMQVSLKELNRVLKPEANVIVSVRYAQLVGLSGKPVSSTLDVMTYAAASGKADLKLESFEEVEHKPNLTPLDKDKEDKPPAVQASVTDW